MQDIKNDVESKGLKLSNVAVKVKRKGTAKDDTSYRLDLDDEILNLGTIAGEAIDLPEFFKPHTSEQILRIVQGEKWDDVMKRDEEIEAVAKEEEEEIEIS